jgi:ribosomal protein L12E/L44/L45/RPP1/RPP2
VKEPRLDDERLSALLAGRLEGPERDELLAHLSTADEDLEVFAHAAAILREMEEEDAREERDAREEEERDVREEEEEPGPGTQAAPPLPPEILVPSMTRSTRGWPRKTPRWAVLSAVAGLVVLGWLMWPRSGAPDVTPLRLALNVGDAGAGLPFDASRPSEGIPGESTRGEGASDASPESAAQAGAFLVRLSLAVQEGDSAATATLALQARERFDPRGARALRDIEERAGDPPAELRPLLEEATGRLEDRLGADYLRVGAWTEAARLAALQRNAAFFRSADGESMLGFAEGLTDDDPRREAVAAVRRQLPRDGRADWIALEASLDAMLKAFAS